MNEINAKFKENTDKVFETSSKIAYEVDVLGDRLIKSGEDIAKASKVSIKNIEQVNMALEQTAEDLGTAVTSSNAKVENVMGDYRKYIADFNTITAEASTGVVEISSLINQQSDKMIKFQKTPKNWLMLSTLCLMTPPCSCQNVPIMPMTKLKAWAKT